MASHRSPEESANPVVSKKVIEKHFESDNYQNDSQIVVLPKLDHTFPEINIGRQIEISANQCSQRVKEVSSKYADSFNQMTAV